MGGENHNTRSALNNFNLNSRQRGLHAAVVFFNVCTQGRAVNLSMSWFDMSDTRQQHPRVSMCEIEWEWKKRIGKNLNNYDEAFGIVLIEG